MTSSGAGAVADPEVVDRGNRLAGRVAAAGAVAMALCALAPALFASVPGPVRVAAAVLAALAALLGLGLWHRSPAAIVVGVVVGGLVVFVGVEGLLASGDDVYEHLPEASWMWVPALVLALGAWVLVGAAATVPASGRIGRWVALCAVVAGLVLVGTGARWLLEVHPLAVVARGQTNSISTDGVSNCGSAFDPGPASLATGCWGQLLEARDDGRLALAIGAALSGVGAGMVLGQFGRRAWPAVAAGGGVLTIALAMWLRAMPLQSTYCASSYEQFGGPVCADLREARSAVWVTFLVAGAGLVAAGLVGSARRVFAMRASDTAPPPAAQVSA